MNKLRCIFFAFLASIHVLYGQIQRVENFEMPLGITEIELDKIIVGLDQKLNEYRRLGKLANPKTHVIDRESINAFKGLFEKESKLYNDMQETSDDILFDVDTYANLARNYFNQDGLRFSITDPILKRVDVYDEEIVCVVALLKSTDQFYTSTGDVKQESRVIKLEFVFAIQKSNLNASKIRTIRSGIEVKLPADYTSYLGLDLRGGVQQVGYKQSTDIEKFGAKGTVVSTSTSAMYQAGFVWYSNFLGRAENTRKNLFATIGLNAQYAQVAGHLNNYSLPPLDTFVLKLSTGFDLDSLVFQAKKVDINEKLSSIQLQVPIGLGYRLWHKKTMNLLLDITYVPGLSLWNQSEIGNNSSGSYNLYGIKGKSNYDYIEASKNGTNELSAIYDLLIKDRSLGAELPINYSWKPKMALTHQIGASITLFKDFIDDSPSLGIALGLSAIFGLTPAIENTTLDKGALFSGLNKERKDIQYQNTTGILSTYIQDVTLRNVGIRVVVYRKAVREPNYSF